MQPKRSNSPTSLSPPPRAYVQGQGGGPNTYIREDEPPPVCSFTYEWQTPPPRTTTFGHFPMWPDSIGEAQPGATSSQHAGGGGNWCDGTAGFVGEQIQHSTRDRRPNSPGPHAHVVLPAPQPQSVQFKSMQAGSQQQRSKSPTMVMPQRAPTPPMQQNPSRVFLGGVPNGGRTSPPPMGMPMMRAGGGAARGPSGRQSPMDGLVVTSMGSNTITGHMNEMGHPGGVSPTTRFQLRGPADQRGGPQTAPIHTPVPIDPRRREKGPISLGAPTANMQQATAKYGPGRSTSPVRGQMVPAGRQMQGGRSPPRGGGRAGAGSPILFADFPSQASPRGGRTSPIGPSNNDFYPRHSPPAGGGLFRSASPTQGGAAEYFARSSSPLVGVSQQGYGGGRGGGGRVSPTWGQDEWRGGGHGRPRQYSNTGAGYISSASTTSLFEGLGHPGGGRSSPPVGFSARLQEDRALTTPRFSFDSSTSQPHGSRW
eukprot:TRINITY_DN64235_c0_g4_i1.p1 TRINITY_DN64235_c0_g4~~TRINITY_DN64235_c0_g4_i1.p1  ORF type:complete len:482 (+),score=50.42 TRINITY_DN64235_c0_g4_i1:78-1523(+)